MTFYWLCTSDVGVDICAPRPDGGVTSAWYLGIWYDACLELLASYFSLIFPNPSLELEFEVCPSFSTCKGFILPCYSCLLSLWNTKCAWGLL